MRLPLQKPGPCFMTNASMVTTDDESRGSQVRKCIVPDPDSAT